MRFELFIALRYLLARRKQAFISVISLISTVGVAVGVIALIVALALMTGIQGELRDRILGSTAHIYVWKTGGIEDYHAEVKKLLTVPGVRGAAPGILGKGMISSPGGKSARGSIFPKKSIFNRSLRVRHCRPCLPPASSTP